MTVVVVCGGRDYSEHETLFRVLDDLHQRLGPITLVRNGGMTGADAWSSRWAYERKVDTECMGARWGEFGAAAGPIRNRRMLDSSVDLVLAFPGGAGTRHCVSEARRRGLTVIDVSTRFHEADFLTSRVLPDVSDHWTHIIWVTS